MINTNSVTYVRRSAGLKSLRKKKIKIICRDFAGHPRVPRSFLCGIISEVKPRVASDKPKRSVRTAVQVRFKRSTSVGRRSRVHTSLSVRIYAYIFFCRMHSVFLLLYVFTPLVNNNNSNRTSSVKNRQRETHNRFFFFLNKK